jgi:putative CocE/NonD family hydrolase
MDQALPRPVQAGCRERRHLRHASEGQAFRARPAELCRERRVACRPRLGVLDLACRRRRRLSFVTPPLEQDTEITGPLAAQLWVSSTTEDMDLFLTLRNIDPDGNDVLEVGQQGQPVPVAKGWLRVSHRELDPELSLPYRPYHKHLRRQWLKPNEIVEVQVEVWPTSMVFKKGHRIRLDIQPRDGIGSAPYTHYHADYNIGENTIYFGGDKDSFLLVPIIPPR